MIDKYTIYRDEGSVDINVINHFENKIGFCLPENYKKIISKHDGLRLEEDTFDFINIYGQNDERDITFLSYQPQVSKYSRSGYYIPMEDFQIIKNEYGIQRLVAFGDCANGDYICFDYRHDPKTCSPKVVLLYHDDYVELEDGSKHMVVNFVADSFEEFIDMLHE